MTEEFRDLQSRFKEAVASFQPEQEFREGSTVSQIRALAPDIKALRAKGATFAQISKKLKEAGLDKASADVVRQECASGFKSKKQGRPKAKRTNRRAKTEEQNEAKTEASA